MLVLFQIAHDIGHTIINHFGVHLLYLFPNDVRAVGLVTTVLKKHGTHHQLKLFDVLFLNDGARRIVDLFS